MPFRFRQLVHDVDHIPFIDERSELHGKSSFVRIHIIEFRRLEPVHEVLAYQMLAIRKKVLLPFTPDTCQTRLPMSFMPLTLRAQELRIMPLNCSR